jgi:hypothetical protein
MRRIQRITAALRGKPSWAVKKGFGTFLTFEFGEPRLVIREPVTDSKAHSLKVRRMLKRRHVHVAGEWHLWVYMCDWRVLSDERVVGDSSSTRRITRAAKFLNGQALIDIILARRGARTTFLFDLGGVLETRPYDRRSEQWLLYEPDGHVFTLRADRRYSYCMGDHKGPERWRAV